VDLMCDKAVEAAASLALNCDESDKLSFESTSRSGPLTTKSRGDKTTPNVMVRTLSRPRFRSDSIVIGITLFAE
jgi:hypothetical protein